MKGQTPISIRLGILLVLSVSSCFASAPPPPPNLADSCAHAEYAADRQAGLPMDASATPEVVLGDVRSHLNTSEQLVMGRQVTVCAKGLYNWLYVKKHPASGLHLLVGGQILSGLALSSLSPPGQEYVNFTLHVDSPESPDWQKWAEVVDASRQSPDHKVAISLAQDSQVFESNTAATVPPYPRYWYLILCGLAGLLGLMVYLAATTTLLKVKVGLISSPEAPYSLGLVQMAFWFYLALTGYIYICASTLQIHIPMGSVLGLLGISATTGLASVAVDSRKSASPAGQGRPAVGPKATHNSTVPVVSDQEMAKNSAEGSTPLEDQLPQTTALLPHGAPIAIQSGATSRGILVDILSDGYGMSFHRFQIVAWTFVLGAVFLWGVYRNMSMPTFDASLLTLMGISSGTYIGFKFPEAPKA